RTAWERGRRSMTQEKYFVIQRGGEWKIKFRDETFGPYRSRDEALLFAIDAAKNIARQQSAAQVLVEDFEDRFLTQWSSAAPEQRPAAGRCARGTPRAS